MILFIDNEVVLLMDGTHPAHVRGEMPDCVGASHRGSANIGVTEIAAYEFMANRPRHNYQM